MYRESRHQSHAANHNPGTLHELSRSVHPILRTQLPGCLQQQRRHPQVRQHDNQRQDLQVQPAPLLAAELHGRFHLVTAIRRRESD